MFGENGPMMPKTFKIFAGLTRLLSFGAKREKSFGTKPEKFCCFSIISIELIVPRYS